MPPVPAHGALAPERLQQGQLGAGTHPDARPVRPMTREQMIAHLREADAIGREAASHDHHPFGAVLVGPDDGVLMRQGNLDVVRHAETELARRATAAYAPEYRWRCTLVTTFEPCAMCTGTLYWANIGRLVYGVEEAKLLALTGDSPENPTMLISSRTVLAAGQKPVEVHGPFPEIEDELVACHLAFWRR
jgi:tRNA(Arg) A34 adenosine deaminase TadA